MIRTSCRALLNLIGGQCGKSNALSVGVYAIEENCLFISEINIPFIDHGIGPKIMTKAVG